MEHIDDSDDTNVTTPKLRRSERLDRRKNSTEAVPVNTEEDVVTRRSRKNRERLRTGIALMAACSAQAMFTSTHNVTLPSIDHIIERRFKTSSEQFEIPFSGLTSMDQSQLEYLTSLDAINDAGDEDHEIWTPQVIYKHRVYRHGRKGKIHVRMKVGWKTESPSWINYDALMRQCPYLVIHYVKVHDLQRHKRFQWVNEIPEEREVHLAKVFAASARDNTPIYKFGEIVPRNVAHALYLDKLNGNNAWQDAMDTEIGQINEYKTFRLPRKGEDLSIYTRIPYHIVFDVKFDLRKKARLVAGGNHTDPPKEDIYSGVVDLMTVRMGYMIAALNDLQVCAADIGNAFLNGKTREKVYIKAGKEFGQLVGSPLIIDRGLYGLRSSGARFHEHLSCKLRLMGYAPTKADTDFWIKDCGTHYEYIATYVDDVLVFSKDPISVIEELRKDYILKGVGQPRYYLGGDVFELDGTWQKDNIHTALSAHTYIDRVMEKFEQVFSTPEQTFAFRKYDVPMEPTYHPESDDSEFLEPRMASIYRGLIGSANWMVTLGRYDINYAVNTMARYNIAPRIGHLKAMQRLFGYLKANPKGQLLIDANVPDHSNFVVADQSWTEFYPDASEELPHDMPIPKGKVVRTTCYVDADHAHDVVTRRSVTGVLLFMNGMPVKWYSKRQKTVETSSYGSELVAARMAVDLIVELRYKLRMLGIPIEGPTMMLGDNMSVVINTTIPSSQLKKKHNAIAYHRVRESVAGKIIQFAHIRSEDNLADCLTKPLPRFKFTGVVKPVLFRTPTFGSDGQTTDDACSLEKELHAHDELGQEVLDEQLPISAGVILNAHDTTTRSHTA